MGNLSKLNLSMSISYQPGKGPETQLRYNLNVHSLEIQDLKKNVDMEYKIKAIINSRSKTGHSYSRVPCSLG